MRTSTKLKRIVAVALISSMGMVLTPLVSSHVPFVPAPLKAFACGEGFSGPALTFVSTVGQYHQDSMSATVSYSCLPTNHLMATFFTTGAIDGNHYWHSTNSTGSGSDTEYYSSTVASGTYVCATAEDTLLQVFHDGPCGFAP